MSYTEAPMVTLEDVAFAEVAAQPPQQVQSQVKDGNGYTTYEEFAKKYQHYLETEDDSF